MSYVQFWTTGVGCWCSAARLAKPDMTAWRLYALQVCMMEDEPGHWRSGPREGAVRIGEKAIHSDE